MQILHSLPREDGFSMPAEFEPHEGCFLIWPERPDSWAGRGLTPPGRRLSRLSPPSRGGKR